jgi:hypothetical protein
MLTSALSENRKLLHHKGKITRLLPSTQKHRSPMNRTLCEATNTRSNRTLREAIRKGVAEKEKNGGEIVASGLWAW